MAHAIGSATISFGLVSIPVKLHSTSESSASISFNLLHDSCGSRLKQQYLCAQEGVVVERGEMVKGYEFSKGRYVVLTAEELKAIEQKATESIDITEFVPADTVDPIYFNKAYYLSPNRGAERAYALLAEAMRKTGRWAVARYAARGRDYLVCVRPGEGALVMQQLHFSAEIKSIDELGIADTELKEQELKMAIQLAELGAADSFNPEQYHDSARSRMRELIQRKIDGEDITVAEPEEPKGEVIDLMAALRASLAKVPTKKAAARVPIKEADRKPAKQAPRAAAKKVSSRGARAK